MNSNGGYLHCDSASGEWQVINDEDGSIIGSYARHSDAISAADMNAVSDRHISDEELTNLWKYGIQPRGYYS